MTFGYLVGEVVRRISGKSLGTFFADEVAGPLGLQAWIGLPEEQEDKVARIEYVAPFTLEEMTEGILETTGLDADTVNAWMTAVWGEGSVQAQAGVLGGAFDPTSDYFTKRAWRAAEVPAANMVADARSVARMYAATVSDVDGIRLLEPATVEPGRGGQGLPGLRERPWEVRNAPPTVAAGGGLRTVSARPLPDRARCAPATGSSSRAVVHGTRLARASRRPGARPSGRHRRVLRRRVRGPAPA